MTDKRSPLNKTAIVTGAVLLASIAAAFAFLAVPYGLGWVPGVFPPTMIFVQLVVTTFNVVIFVTLTGAYVSLYRDLPNQYTRSLVALSIALVLYALTSHPLVPFLLGDPLRLGIRLLAFLPDMFMGVAAVVLYYQNQT